MQKQQALLYTVMQSLLFFSSSYCMNKSLITQNENQPPKMGLTRTFAFTNLNELCSKKNNPRPSSSLLLELRPALKKAGIHAAQQRINKELANKKTLLIK